MFKRKVIEEKELSEFGDFTKSRTVVTESCSSCLLGNEQIKALESKLAKAVEALRGLYLLLQSEQYVKAHMEFFSKQDKRESYETGLANLAFNKDLAERLRFELLTAKKTLEEIGEQE